MLFKKDTSKLASDRRDNTMFALGLVTICVLSVAIAQVTMKHGMNQIGDISNIWQLFNFNTLFKIFTNPFVFIGIIIHIVAAILWLGALSSLEVSFIYPLLSLGYVVTAVFAWIFLKESINLFRWLGIIFVIVGCFLIVKMS